MSATSAAGSDPDATDAAAGGASVGAWGDRPARVLVVGDLIDDLVVQPGGPIAYATDTPSRITPTLGGSAANQATWLAAAGARARLVARVGAADVDRHTRALRAAGVEPWLIADPDLATGTIVILLDETGERSMFTDRGANLGLCVEDLPDGVLDDVDALHLTGYSLFDDEVRAAVLDLVERARSREVPITIDPSSTGFLRSVGAATFLGWIGEVAALLPNADEAKLLSGDADPHDAARTLLAHAPLVAVTCGSAGAVVATRDADPVQVPAPDVEVVDTTGAGDAFTGAFLAAWLTGADAVQSTEAGVAAGARAVAVTGGRPGP